MALLRWAIVWAVVRWVPYEAPKRKSAMCSDVGRLKSEGLGLKWHTLPNRLVANMIDLCKDVVQKR
jgi:hypothetical protein